MHAHLEDVRRSCVITICTYKRPEMLFNLHQHLERVVVPEDWDVRLLVIDNDPDGSAGGVLQRGRWPMTYVHETEPGLSAARNRAIAESLQDDELVFLDDDELPRDDWLLAFAASRRRFPDAVLAGPVIPRFEGALPTWASGGWPYVRPSPPDGTLLGLVGDGNVCIPLATLTATGVRYDLALTHTGGQDTKFFTELARHGVTIRWSAGATVDELIPLARLNRRYVADRARWGAATYAYSGLGIPGWRVRRLLAVVRFLVLAAWRLVSTPFRRQPVSCSVMRAYIALLYARGTVDGLRGRLKPRVLT